MFSGCDREAETVPGDARQLSQPDRPDESQLDGGKMRCKSVLGSIPVLWNRVHGRVLEWAGLKFDVQ